MQTVVIMNRTPRLFPLDPIDAVVVEHREGLVFTFNPVPTIGGVFSVSGGCGIAETCGCDNAHRWAELACPVFPSTRRNWARSARRGR